MMNSLADDIIERLKIYRNNAISISDFICDKKSTTAIELTQISKDIESIMIYLHDKDSTEIEQLIFNLLKSKLTEQQDTTTIETDKYTYTDKETLETHSFNNQYNKRCNCNTLHNEPANLFNSFNFIIDNMTTFICKNCKGILFRFNEI